MRQSIYVRTEYRTDIGREDWWPLAVLVDAAGVAINITAKHGRYFPRPDGLFPTISIQCVEDLPRLIEHSKALIFLLGQQGEEMAQIVAMPGLLSKRPDPDSTIDILIDAAERLAALGKVARQIAGACVASIEYKPTTALDHAGLQSVVAAWNRALHIEAERYVTFVESIPDGLARFLVHTRTGQTEKIRLVFNVEFNTEEIRSAVALMHALTSEEQPFLGPRAGKIYALLNPSMPGLVKIGKTTRNSELRADELHTTGVPTPFIVLYEVNVDDCDEAERLMHETLAVFRLSDRREFFRVAPKVAVAAMTGLR